MHTHTYTHTYRHTLLKFKPIKATETQRLAATKVWRIPSQEHSMLNLETNSLQHQRTTPGATPLSTKNRKLRQQHVLLHQ